MMLWRFGNIWLNPDRIVSAIELGGKLIVVLTNQTGLPAAAREELEFVGADAVALKHYLNLHTRPLLMPPPVPSPEEKRP